MRREPRTFPPLLIITVDEWLLSVIDRDRLVRRTLKTSSMLLPRLNREIVARGPTRPPSLRTPDQISLEGRFSRHEGPFRDPRTGVRGRKDRGRGCGERRGRSLRNSPTSNLYRLRLGDRRSPARCRPTLSFPGLSQTSQTRRDLGTLRRSHVCE